MRSGVGIIASAGGAAAGVDVLREDFDNFTDAPWTLTGTPTIVAGRTGNAASIAGNTARADYTIPAVNESDQVTIGFAWRTNTTSTSQRALCELWSDTNTVRHTRLVYNGTTSQSLSVTRDTTTLQTSATGLIPVNTWAYVELKVRLHDTLGSAVVRVNGVEVINVTGVDTKNAGTKTVYDDVRLVTNQAGITNLWDDLYLSVGGAPFKGDQVIT